MQPLPHRHFLPRNNALLPVLSRFPPGALPASSCPIRDSPSVLRVWYRRRHTSRQDLSLHKQLKNVSVAFFSRHVHGSDAIRCLFGNVTGPKQQLQQNGKDMCMQKPLLHRRVLCSSLAEVVKTVWSSAAHTDRLCYKLSWLSPSRFGPDVLSWADFRT